MPSPGPYCPWRSVVVATDHPDLIPSAAYIKHHVIGIGTVLDVAADLVWTAPDSTPCRLHLSGRHWPSSSSVVADDLGLVLPTTSFYICRRAHDLVAVPCGPIPDPPVALAPGAVVVSQPVTGRICRRERRWHCRSSSVICADLGHGPSPLPSPPLLPLSGDDRLRHAIGNGAVGSVIVYGPDGNGKRTRIRAAAAAAGIAHVSVSVADLFADRLADPVDAFRAEIRAAAALRPVVVTLRAVAFALARAAAADDDGAALCAALRRLLRDPPDQVTLAVPARDRLPAGFEDAAHDLVTLGLPDPVPVLGADGLAPGWPVADLLAIRRRARWAPLRTALAELPPASLRDASPVTVPDVRWGDIGGLAATVAALQEIVQWPLENGAAFAALGVVPLRGCLLYGPPGTGKTLLAQAVATESGARFVSVAIADLIRAEVGASEAFLRETFGRARDAAPCVVFFDEFQAMFASRDADPNGGAQLLAQLLAEIDAAPAGVVVLAAANRPDLIDPALLRPGRFDRVLLVPPPDLDGRLAILERIRRRSPIAPDVDAVALARRTPGFTGADLQNLVQKAGLCALLRDGAADQIRAGDFDAALRAGMAPSVTEAVMQPLRRWGDSIHRRQINV